MITADQAQPRIVLQCFLRDTEIAVPIVLDDYACDWLKDSRADITGPGRWPACQAGSELGRQRRAAYLPRVQKT
jgi:hypothetical protein